MNTRNRCKLCGVVASHHIHIEPEGVCTECYFKIPLYIPAVQEYKYLEMLVKKRKP